jgi:hypothetical protein
VKGVFMTQALQIGRLLRANTSGCVVGCKVTQVETPSLGSLVRIPMDETANFCIYGLITDIHVEDDGLVRQLVTAENVSEEVILDNRNNRNVPLEISVAFCGYKKDKKISHLLPARPPLTLDKIFLCSEHDIFEFTALPLFGYFRHLLRNKDIPVGEVLASHLQQTVPIHQSCDNADWINRAVKELITALRDDYPVLIDVLRALADADLPLSSVETTIPGGLK